MFTSRFSSQSGPVGIDFGARFIKLVQLCRVRGEFGAVGSAVVPYSDDEENSDPTALRDSLRRAIGHGGFTGRKCVVSLKRSDTLVQSVRMPKMTESELRDAVKWEAADRFKLDRNACEVEYLHLGDVQQGTEKRDEVLIIAVAHETIERRLAPLLDAGLRPIAIDTGFSALARLHSLKYRRDSDQDVTRAILEVGSTGSTVLIVRGDAVGFCKQIRIGGCDLEKAVIDALQVDPETACNLRTKRLQNASNADERGHDQATSDPADRAVYDAVRPHLEHLCEEFAMCMRYFSVTFRGQPPTLAILAGGDASEPGLKSILHRHAKMNVVHDDPGSPVQGIFDCIRATADGSSHPVESWAVAAGLSLRGLIRSDQRSESDSGSVREAA